VTGLDYAIFGLYLAGVLSVGLYFYRRNESSEDYFLAGRSMGAGHVGLSIAATDVGGGFSIGLGGLGFTMGLAGSWLLFTGLIGAWLSAVLIIPRIKKIDSTRGLFTYPDFLRLRYGDRVAFLAAIISGLGYMGFTGGQVLAGAKLAAGTFLTQAPMGLRPVTFAVLLIAGITVLYTFLGGMKAVIYTDTIQWIILITGLVAVTIPVTLSELGGLSGLRAALPAKFFSLGNVEPVTFFNWMVSIIPIWLVGMTLYQRMYACRDRREAQKAWLIAGLFEYPVMAFSGAFLGLCARVWFPQAEAEMGLPMLIANVLPMGVTGIVIAAYFSAIMSTADSCLMASSGNIVNDIIERYIVHDPTPERIIRLSQIVTLLIGISAIAIAISFTNVLDAILYAYGFMVSGLFVPTLGAYFWRGSSPSGAFWGMLIGGTVTVALSSHLVHLPAPVAGVGLNPTVYGIVVSAVVFIAVSLLTPDPVPEEGQS